MAADLAVAFDGHGAFLQVHALEHGVFAETLLDIQRRFLQALFLCVRGGLFFFLTSQNFIIREKIQLQGSVFRNILLADQAGNAVR